MKIVSRDTAGNFALLDHFLPRDVSAERGNEIACRPSVCPSVCL